MKGECRTISLPDIILSAHFCIGGHNPSHVLCNMDIIPPAHFYQVDRIPSVNFPAKIKFLELLNFQGGYPLPYPPSPTPCPSFPAYFINYTLILYQQHFLHRNSVFLFCMKSYIKSIITESINFLGGTKCEQTLHIKI